MIDFLGGLDSRNRKIEDKRAVINKSCSMFALKVEEVVPPDMWNSYSSHRQESFRMMYKNPNIFFYRNRPPGDPQKRGPFTREEEEQFLERLRYFRDDLGISNGWWGLFAVPLRGRVGYQCSNFYRRLVREGKITALDNGSDELGRRKVSQDALDRLAQEALDFIQVCSGKGKACESSPDISPPSPQPETTPPATVPATSSVRIRLPTRDRRPQRPEPQKEGEAMSILQSARDCVTGEPMSYPCLDVKSGIVLDKTTWLRVFKGEITVPAYATGMADLVVMTKRNFSKYWMDIVNVSF